MNSEDVLRRRIEEIDFYIKNYKEMIEFLHWMSLY